MAQPTQGFFLDDFKPKNAVIPPYTNFAPPAMSPTATITINCTDTLAKVSKYIFGTNANVYMSQMVDQPDLLNHIQTLSPNIIRFPGGNLSSVFFWDASKDQLPADVPDTLLDVEGKKYSNYYWFGKNTESWTLSLDNYYKMLEMTSSTGIITVNYSYARYGTGPTPVQTAAHYAAEWVRYDKGRTRYWEIGNENAGTWQAGYRIDTRKNKDGQPEIITGELYGQHFNVFADSMRAAAAEIGTTIHIGAQLIQTEPPSWDTQVNKTWNAGLFKAIGNAADFFIVHSYYTPYGQNSTPDQILSTPGLESRAIMDYISKSIQTAGVAMKPVALTEWNIFAEGSRQYVSYINGIHATMTLGELIKNKYGMASRWDLANGWNNGNDHGMFSQGDEPGNVPKWNPRPVFYYMYYFQKFFGNYLVTSSTTGSSTIVAYASIFDSGQAGVVIVNKGNTAETVALDLQNFGYGNRYYVYSLTGGQDNGNFSLNVLVNGQRSPYAAGGPATVENISALSATMENGIKVAAPARSVHYVLVENGNGSPLAIDKTETTYLHVFPNPSGNQFTIDLPEGKFSKIEIVDIHGTIIYSQPLLANQHQLNLHTQLKPGIYLVRLHSSKHVHIAKLLIQ
ncbi:T9SS type A sorting domain-containing protein [Rhodocytophaga aerolata]|uniref:T9SS type A sorting domain-containing protein n=1 Tax=Rhodocytophaga aerolata TaxID=455078 RepID=A0ABT8R4R0_9BACT|nr:T9SS type A sorting domain-containing protein [Rhodocytophaga aerolata]MDO1447074.1 T9SS type A sorting domain-containing protein [Rhodocytophaga aerolata]